MNKISTSIKQVLFVFVLIAAFAGFTACEKYTFNPPAVDPDHPWSFSNDIQPIFNNSRCTECHRGGVPPDLRAGQSYNMLTRGNYVDSPAEQSRLVVKITSDPDHSILVTDADRLKIRYWIEQGAKNN